MSLSGDLLGPSLALILLGLGLLCLLVSRRVIKQVIGLSIMLQGALVIYVDAGRENGRLEVAQGMMISALVVEAIVLTIILGLIVNVYRYHPAGRVDDLDKLKG